MKQSKSGSAGSWRTVMTAGAMLMLSVSAQARITDIEILSIAPSGPGSFDQIDGIARGAVDPNDPRNAVITDIHLAPRNADGLVEYITEFRILRPTAEANGVLLYDVVNRGNVLSELVFGPTVLGVPSIPRERRYISVWSGWQGDLKPSPARLNLDVPVATQSGTPITGTVRTEYLNASGSTLDLSSGAFTGNSHLSYPAVSPDTSQATLTRRLRETDPREPIPSSEFAFADCAAVPFPGDPDPTKICLNGGFDPAYIYELLYEAKDPLVLGLGFAATRDLVSFLRHEDADDDGTPNPVAGDVETTLVHGTSQSGRYVRGFLQLGFNEDESGKRVFDGANPHIAAGRIPLNVRFGQPGRAYGEREDHLFPAYESPFNWHPLRDKIANHSEGLLDRCRRSNTCPKIMQTVSSTEYWQGRASLDATDAFARHDVGIPGNVRMFLFSSTQHFALPGTTPSIPGGCEQLSNPNSYVPHMRALLVALEQWVRENRKPPKTMIPTLRKRTLATSGQESLGFPDIPGVLYNGTYNELTLIDYGPLFEALDESGILLEPPLVIDGADYQVRLPTVDADGNEIAGIRSPDIAAPIGTYTGWNIISATGELCGLSGSFVPFAETRAERLAAGDPRLSLEERYGDHQGYVDAVRKAAEKLVRKRLLLPADADRFVDTAQMSDVLK
ncbi:MAG: alpha/beta hydrolase domain-containing protein [Betaproteobacteria bacterium]|nr:alpha/beta hydrolase domain-containing protein [Betaproteobacteria bacterium]